MAVLVNTGKQVSSVVSSASLILIAAVAVSALPVKGPLKDDAVTIPEKLPPPVIVIPPTFVSNLGSVLLA